jgi:hypothetical protein
MGPNEGFAAVIYALDDGYSAEQISTATFTGTLGDTGQIAGVQPEGPPNDFITAPGEPAGFAHREVRFGVARSAGNTTVSPEEVYREIDQKMTTVATLQLLGAGLGVGADITYEDVFPSTSTANETGRAASAEGAKVMIGVLLALMDVGYTFDQALNGYIFGEWRMVPSLGPYSVCLVLSDDDGTLIQPDASGNNYFFGSATCADAIREGTIDFEGLDEAQMAANAPDGEADQTENESVATPAEPEPTATIYRGEGVHRKTLYRSAADDELVCEHITDMELRLEPDGTATFTYFVGIGMEVEVDGEICNDISGNAWSGTWDSDGSFTIPQPSDGIETWEVDGSFDEESAFGPAYYTLYTQLGDDYLRDTIEFEFNLHRVD